MFFKCRLSSGCKIYTLKVTDFIKSKIMSWGGGGGGYCGKLSDLDQRLCSLCASHSFPALLPINSGVWPSSRTNIVCPANVNMYDNGEGYKRDKCSHSCPQQT